MSASAGVLQGRIGNPVKAGAEPPLYVGRFAAVSHWKEISEKAAVS